MAIDISNQETMVSDIPGDTISRRAFSALTGQAKLFEECEMFHHSTNSGTITLKNDQVSFDLLFDTRRKLLSRIYHLRIVSRMVPLGDYCSDDRYSLKLMVSRLGRIQRSFSINGNGVAEGQALSDKLLLSGLVEKLSESVTIEHLSISWDPGTGQWEVSVGPYPGSYVYLIFPPMKHNVKLMKTEATALYSFIADLTHLLNARCIL